MGRLLVTGGDTKSHSLSGPFPPVRDPAEYTGILIDRDLFKKVYASWVVIERG